MKKSRLRRSAAVRSFFIVASVLIATAATAAQGKVLRTSGNEVFCRNKADFAEYLAVANDKKLSRAVPGCMEPRKGLRYELLEEHPPNGVDKIRLFINGRRIEGYVIGRGG
jgi:hypothetical protein